MGILTLMALAGLRDANALNTRRIRMNKLFILFCVLYGLDGITAMLWTIPAGIEANPVLGIAPYWLIAFYKFLLVPFLVYKLMAIAERKEPIIARRLYYFAISLAGIGTATNIMARWL
jgi:hypothetical protein